MKVSVVIPAYNEVNYIGACLESLMKQEVPADEIIVINNNSTDETVKIIKKYPIKVVNEKIQGMIPARNRGFNEAQYDIIARTDADTIVPPDWIKTIKANFKDKKLVAFSGPANFYELPDQTSKLTIKAFFPYASLFKQIMKHDCLYGPNIAIRKNAWEKVKNDVCLDDKEVHEDLDLAIHLAPFGKIKFDYDFVVKSSFRRWKKLESYFEYTNRALKSIRKHKKLVDHRRGIQAVKRIVSKAFLTDSR